MNLMKIDTALEQGVDAVRTLVLKGFSGSIERFNLVQKYKFHRVWMLELTSETWYAPTSLVVVCSFELLIEVYWVAAKVSLQFWGY
jgi:hypothetical protein